MRCATCRGRGFVLAALVLFGSPGLRAVDTFEDDFARADGPVDGWTNAFGTWQIAGESLASAATTVAPGNWIWVGDPPIVAEGDLNIDANIGFGDIATQPVGSHGGFMLYAAVATERGDAANSGYTVDWIDRVDDHGFRVIRLDNGVATILLGGTPEVVDRPGLWTIEVEGDAIRIYGDGEFVAEVFDETYREGRIGLWSYQNNSELLVDDILIEYEAKPIVPCFTADPRGGEAPVEVTFDATCSQAGLDIVSYEWSFGDGESAEGAVVTHTYVLGDTYIVSLEVTDAAGNSAIVEDTLTVVEVRDTFQDDFERADGAVEGWTATLGEWSLLGGELTTLATGTESWIWAGEPAFRFPDIFSVGFTMTFGIPPADGVGRHAGLLFCGSVATDRYDGAMNGYTVDWIDRPEDHGFRLIRITGGAQTVIALGGRDLVEPPEEWRIEVGPELIRIIADGDVVIEARDATYRGGFFGVWAYLNGTEVFFDDVDLTVPDLASCFVVEPAGAQPVGGTFAFDGTCSRGLDITGYTWSFGDGETAQGASVEHTFATPGNYEVVLAIETAGGETAEASRVVTVYDVVSEYDEDFTQDDGAPEDWTVASGTWSVFDGALQVDANGGAEAFSYAGSPAVFFDGVTEVSFDVEFLAIPADVVGRHGGLMLFAGAPLPRASTSGYEIDWIDRAEDRGYRFIRYDQGIATIIVSGTGDLEPAIEWRIEVDDEAIRFYGDDEFKFEVLDSTYRSGFFGFWSYVNGQSIIFDNVVATSDVVEPRETFRRGDADASGALNITDGIFILNFLFLGGAGPSCSEAADADNSGAINITDGIYVLNFLFLGGPAPAAPGADACGPDPDAEGSAGDIGCEAFAPCA